jgi:hypothetical protein
MTDGGELHMENALLIDMLLTEWGLSGGTIATAGGPHDTMCRMGSNWHPGCGRGQERREISEVQ